MNGQGQSMQAKYNERWGVVVGKDTFTLDENQIEVLKDATRSNMRGIVWFDKFAISIPHIQSIYRISRTIKNKIESPQEKIDDEAWKRGRKRITEIRKKLSEKLAFGKKRKSL